MTAASFHAMTGEIIGSLGWTQAIAVPFYNNVYSGDPSGVYISNLDFWDGIASLRLGLSVNEFRAWPSSLRTLYRNKAEKDYGSITGGTSASGKAAYSSVVNLVSGSSYANQSYNQQHASNDGLTEANVDAELLIGFIPEWGNGTSQSNIDARDLAIKKMGWSFNKTVEFAKAVRRERNISIRAVFDKIIKFRNGGYSVAQTAKKTINQ